MTDDPRALGSLDLSGSAGLLATFATVAYLLAVRDPVLLDGGGSPPEWLSLAAFTLAIGSLAVAYYASIAPALRARGMVTVISVLSQWGLPASIVLLEVGPIDLSAGFVPLVFAGGHVVAALVVVASVAIGASSK